MSILINDVIATRELKIIPEKKTIIVQVGKPCQVSTTEWECAFHISDIGMHELQYGHGIDSFQALINAIEGVGSFLKKNNYDFFWEGGEIGETGIPRYVPMIYGKDFTDYINNFIDSKIEDFAQFAENKSGQSKIKFPFCFLSG